MRTKIKTKTTLQEYLLVIAGAIITAAGIYFFRFPNNFSTGGISGLAIILSKITRFTSGQITAVLNLVLLIAGLVLLGKDFSKRTIIGTFVFSAVITILEKTCPMTKPFTDEPLLELCFAVFIPSIGTAILFNNDASTGGTDIIAMVLRKYARLEIGTAIILSDFAIAALAFSYGVKTGLYSLLGLFVKTVLIDSFIDGFNLCKCFNIITDHPKEICHYINNELGRGATIISAKGAYGDKEHFIIVTVMRRVQARRLREVIKRDYPESFMIVTNSSEIIGKGFQKQ